MSAHSLAMFLQSFLNDFSSILANSSSIHEMLRIDSQESYTNVTDAKYGLIWTWQTFGKRYLVGHEGSVPGITNLMMVNEKRKVGVIVLTNGDVTRQDAQAHQVQAMRINLMTQLFDCFDTNSAATLYNSLFLAAALLLIQLIA